jgi:dimethylaniline monooxygenase (N-oxide forming)
VQDYLEQYARDFALLPHIRFNTKVTNISPPSSPGNPVNVSWEEPENKDAEGVFDVVVVASGIFTQPRRPSDLYGIEAFNGDIIDASAYRDPSEFAGRSVLVVGAAFSGADIAADLAGVATSVTIAARRPVFYLPRYVGGRPADLVFYSRAGNDRSRGLSDDERSKKRHEFLATLSGKLPEPLVAPNQDQGELPFVAITDSFPASVQSGQVSVRCVGVKGFDGGQIVRFSDESTEKFDAVILATGYRLDLPFFNKTELEALEYEPEDWLQPVILHGTVWRLPQVAFVGLYRGPYFAVMELQARWACGVFSGRLPNPNKAEMEAGLAAERLVRSARPRPQFPHGDYVGMAEELARLVGVHPGKLIEESEHPLRELLHEGPLLPFHYRLLGFGAKPKLAEDAIRAAAAQYPILKK